MSANPVPISINNTRRTVSIQANGAQNGFFQHNMIGSGHQGPEVMTRIIMSLKSGISSEIHWALTSLSQISCTSPSLVNFEKSPYLGHELINYFVRPFQLLVENKEKQVTLELVLLSLDSLLSLRNLAQDLSNQQWLSQSKALKKHLIEVVRIFTNWFYVSGTKSHALTEYHNQFREGFNYAIDLLEPLSCYYIDNTRNDPLFNQLLVTASYTRDKYLIVGIIKILTHLLFIKSRNVTKDGKDQHQEEQEEEEAKKPNNCIDAIDESSLENIVNYLLVNDSELNYATLGFIKQYLSSEALHPCHPHSIKESQAARLKLLLQLDTSKANLRTLVKQLPILVVSNLPLLDAQSIPVVPPSTLSRRSYHASIPNGLPQLSKQLYDIIVKFPEPLRATTWLRCCYEPYSKSSLIRTDPDNTEAVPGEVTQISLWKAYEKQFEEVWQTSKTQPNPEWPPLLPAVDFIKNVNSAFPNSEAMVVNLKPEFPEQPVKKRFIIKGIQPRQFVVNIDVANYEALRLSPSEDPDSSLAAKSSNLPFGHIDTDKFNHSLTNLTDFLLAHQLEKDDKDSTPINWCSHDLLDTILNARLPSPHNRELHQFFRLYNSVWLPTLVYANPLLVESGLVDGKWLNFLL